MSLDTHDVPELSLLDQLKVQHSQFLIQREQTQVTLNQLVGAIHACEIMLKKYEIKEVQELPLCDIENPN